jgi:hypothetical protein
MLAKLGLQICSTTNGLFVEVGPCLLSVLASVHDPPDVCLPNSLNYRPELLCLVLRRLLKTSLKKQKTKTL